MRLLACLFLVGFWVAIIFAALVISADPEGGSVAERGADADLPVASAESETEPDAAPAPETVAETAVEEEEAEEVIPETAFEDPEFAPDPELAEKTPSEEETEQKLTAEAEPAVQASIGEVATALPRREEVRRPEVRLNLGVESGQPLRREPANLDEFMSDGDVALYKEIFRVQGAGRWKKADGLISKLDNKVLMGYVLSQRYLHPTAYRSSSRELRGWLAKYGDHPAADKIYNLAMKKRKPGGVLPRKPLAKKKSLIKQGPITRQIYRSTKRLSRKERRRVRNLRARMYRQVERRALTATEKLIATKEVQRLFDQVQLDEATAWVASGWYFIGKYQKAFDLAQGATDSTDEVPLAHWIAGLSAWRLDDLPTAALHFEALALSQKAAGWNDASGPYWAARVHEKLGHNDKVDEWLYIAASHPRTLYGMLARHRLGLKPTFDFKPLVLDGRRIGALSDKPGGARALAFLRLGEHRKVEKELERLEGWEDPAVAEAIMSVADQARLPALSLRISKRLLADKEADWDHSLLDSALYPIPPWEPARGFKLDKALVYAVIRQESQFKRYARSRDGARGLMQLLPSTARGLTKRYNFRGAQRAKLYNPELNMYLGQRYLSQLMKYPYIDGNIFRMATAYNGGPGNLRSWSRRINHKDPLMFIESIPVRETRDFVKHIATNLWVYRVRMGQDAPTMADAAAGAIPLYAKRDGLTLEAKAPDPVEEAEAKSSIWSIFGFN